MKRAKRPNVLLIYTDQQRFDSLGCNGNSLAVTPHLDALAAQGANLQRLFVQNPVCAPSRMSLLTGRYCGSTGIGDNGYVFPEDRLVPLNRIMKPYGYHTAQIGKLHFDPHSNRDHRNPTSSYGFDTFILSDEPGCYDDAYTKWIESIDGSQVDKARTSLPPAAYAHDLPNYSDVPRNTHEPYAFEGEEDFTHSKFVASETCRFIEEHRDSRFFAIAGFYAPHTPVNPPQRILDMFDPSRMPLPVVGKDEPVSPELKDLTDEEWGRIVASYYALVTHVDECVGEIIDTLKAQGLYEDTVIIFTSDHGEYLGDHGRIQKGMPGEDCITRVPCLISYPPLVAGNRKIEALAEAVDLLPTILDICGIQVPTHVQGASLKDLLRGKTDKHKDAALTEAFDNHGNRSVSLRTEKYRYFTDFPTGNEKLFDLEKDPREIENVIGDSSYGEVLSELRKTLIGKLLKAGGFETVKPAKY